MKILLDTHIWLWYLLGNERLSLQLQTAISDPNTELWLSPISIWETLILAEKGRISLQPYPVTWVNLALKTLETREAPMNHAIAILSREIALPHQDPGDRFIAATAIYYGLTLATVDANLTGNSVLQTLS
ncbi:MAG: type II toxin-antitoxin system VapC family toxin [Microcoleus sp. PH2017_10_PVI_O_A]|uniref:type II toxin-antitoxin system VapC family toxin n=1 Tax=unclassified Microcoleus TaxID=2642155 RepID=UPI001DE187EA|nr:MULTISPECIES: type II toxin-antitoxin system VapC family toxin [unclassified Microcoleus]TAE78771.1 MAG: type II toxin-antitoxin system VapC family toxin [Oscillatoriales cyanobacterium]MCC3408675.1 type II toxin-antitoxin system VapC family toxin [Microcoleus sp. PH2017_10_PVI_O_A]MCC3462776.1 type II toxin-antitoxin system VapC family toxin [Microcoleus sp. PH2017_11_PCY_U_A]MCC3481214.1 type II toxin-antitoxin system VapC family toxin [Microcoleus sp. PH2017_12_PCY_D_A]MCC3562185.1 type 